MAKLLPYCTAGIAFYHFIYLYLNFGVFLNFFIIYIFDHFYFFTFYGRHNSPVVGFTTYSFPCEKEWIAEHLIVLALIFSNENYISLYFTIFHYILLYFTIYHYVSLYSTIFHYIFPCSVISIHNRMFPAFVKHNFAACLLFLHPLNPLSAAID